MKSDAIAFARYALGLPRFLRHPLGQDEARALVKRRLEARAENLLAVVESAIFAQRRSPYRRLLEHAGVELGDVTALVRAEGVEGALERLHGAGVYVTVDEFKGRRPIVRGDLTLPTRAEDFDNPLATRAFESRTGGSRGTPRRIGIDFAHLTGQAVYRSLFLQAFDVVDRPGGVWRAAPPGSAGLGAVIGSAKVGTPVERWFSPSRVTEHPRELLLTAYSLLGAGARVTVVVRPEHVEIEPEGPEGMNSSWPGIVVAAAFLGDAFDYVVEVGGLELRARRHASRPIAQGARVAVRLPDVSCSLIPLD